MSFSSIAKAEICKTPVSRRCCAVAEACGILLYCNTFSSREIKIITENREFAERLKTVFKKAFGITFDSRPDAAESRGKLILRISDRNKLDTIFETLGYETDGVVSHMINFGLIEDDSCRVSFVRGAFLAGGSVTAPEKRYHLELVTGHFNVNRGMLTILLEMGFYPKDISRKGHFVIYFKQSETIEDFLTTIGAPVAAMVVMNAKIQKDMRNSVQRQVNCDTANVEKAVEAAQDQMTAIKHLEKTVGLDNLPDKLQETALLRIFNPEASLSELARLSNPPVSKSCISYRLRKLIEMSKL